MEEQVEETGDKGQGGEENGGYQVHRNLRKRHVGAKLGSRVTRKK